MPSPSTAPLYGRRMADLYNEMIQQGLPPNAAAAIAGGHIKAPTSKLLTARETTHVENLFDRELHRRSKLGSPDPFNIDPTNRS